MKKFHVLGILILVIGLPLLLLSLTPVGNTVLPVLNQKPLPTSEVALDSGQRLPTSSPSIPKPTPIPSERSLKAVASFIVQMNRQQLDDFAKGYPGGLPEAMRVLASRMDQNPELLYLVEAYQVQSALNKLNTVNTENTDGSNNTPTHCRTYSLGYSIYTDCE